ncbi:MAG: TonB-dependent receptor [Leptospiraceae bacterium]|nr:MAG: TonB-dependent receptor [Leptospiraceae bacterium]
MYNLYSQEYVIIVKHDKNYQSSNEQKDIIYLDQQKQFQYTLDKLLEKEAGIISQKYGGEGSYSLVRIRGSNAKQVNIYLNGIPLNFASYSEVDLSDLHIFNYDRIQIDKNGSLSGLTGTSIGGSINLIPDLEKKENQIYIQGGSYKTFGGGIFYQKLYSKKEISSEDNLEYKKENYYAGWNISVYKETSDQNYKFRNHNGTIYFNTLDDYNDIRKNAQYKKTSSFLNGYIKIHQTKIQVLNDTFYRIHGVPGPITRQTDKTKREHLRNTSGIFTDTKGLFIENFRLKSRIYYTYINNNFKDSKNELSFGANSSKAFLHNKGVHLLPELFFPIIDMDFIYKVHFLLGYEEEFFSEDKYTNFGYKTQDIPEKKRFHYSYHFSNKFIFFDGFLEFVPEFRYEEYKNNFFIETQTKQFLNYEEIKKDESKIHFINDSYSLIFNPINYKSNKFKLFLNYREEKRLPAFIELFGEKGSIVPNLKLKPETSFNTEIGLNYVMNHFFIDIRIYNKKVYDLIQFIPNSQFSLRAENLKKAYFQGIEISFKYLFVDMFKYSAGYNYQEAKEILENNFYKKENYIPLIPVHTFKNSIILFPEKKFEYGLDIFYYGAYFRNKSNDYFSYQPPKWIYNFNIYFRWKKNFLFYLEIRNLQNKWYEDIIGYPLPGRNYKIALKYFF